VAQIIMEIGMKVSSSYLAIPGTVPPISMIDETMDDGVTPTPAPPEKKLQYKIKLLKCYEKHHLSSSCMQHTGIPGQFIQQFALVHCHCHCIAL
jgi:hypothetical protein